MNRIKNVFQKSKPFIAYITAGDGGLEYSIDSALAMIEGGVDMLEIGLPFSDPVADGSVIQKAHERALKLGSNYLTVLTLAKALRKKTDIPLILFSYYNPLLQQGVDYLQAVKEAGFDGILVVDLALSRYAPAAEEFFFQVITHQLTPILLATPSTSEARLRAISGLAQGFLYYVSQKGTTGIRSSLADDFASQMARLRKYFKIPIVAGFGISSRATAQAALKHADGFVVGSALVQKMADAISPAELTLFTRSIDPRIA